jgi:hypothetical protein
VKVVSHREYSVFFLICPLFAAPACSGYGSGYSVRGALALSAEAVEANDAAKMFPALDERTRFAMMATVSARSDARALIERDYPEAEKAQALAALGDAGQVQTAAELFGRRCDPTCLRGFGEIVGAPTAQVAVGDELEVTTVHGRTLRMHAGKDGGYGIVWQTRETSDERSRAAKELRMIQDVAAVYRKRLALQHPARP